MNKLIDIILITMKPHLNSNQLSILQVTLNRELSQYDLKEKYTTNLVVVEDQWKVDLRDFLLEKQIEGKSIKTLKQYHLKKSYTEKEALHFSLFHQIQNHVLLTCSLQVLHLIHLY